MGIFTTLSAITPTQTERNSGATNGKDLNGLLSVAQIKASELIQHMKSISNALPPGDPNIAAIAAIITSLS